MRVDHRTLAARARQSRALLDPCIVCPRRCGARRLEGEAGFCRIAASPFVASYGPHFGEEGPLTGWRGSGTVFFSGCNLRCAYCQNHDISRGPAGAPVTSEGLAAMALDLQSRGCHNLNLVSPTHVMPQILAGLAEAARGGFDLPVVWNTGGYESPATLALLDGIVDVYMPDFKYADDAESRTLSQAPDYPRIAFSAIREMHRQVGDLVLDDRGIAVRGLLVRHLVLPGNRAGTGRVLDRLLREISHDTWINVMDQYRPADLAATVPGLDRRPTLEELRDAATSARRAGLHRGMLPGN